MEIQNITSFLQIGEVAKRIGISQRSVRYYEEEGLITPSGSTSGGLRLYNEADVTRLLFINRLRLLGVSLDDIKICMGIEKPPPDNRHERIERTLQALVFTQTKIDEHLSLFQQMQSDNKRVLETVQACLECDKPNCAGCLKKKYLI